MRHFPEPCLHSHFPIDRRRPLISNRLRNEKEFRMAGKHKHQPEVSFYRDLGRAVRLARVAAGKSQADIAAHLELTFQQLQKYESGDNRIPVDRLVSIADYLDMPVSYFLAPDEHTKEDYAFFSLIEAFEAFEAKELASLLECWTAIRDKQVRAAMLNLVRCMASLKR
jgi:transcriptional regulator with XRE-family HTH domain